MKFEHVALNVPDSVAMADWYVKRFAMKIVRQLDKAPFTRFLADATGRVVFELYSNTTAPLPDYPAQHPMVLHLALEVEDPVSLQETLAKEGASFDSEEKFDDGTHLVMMRDPWGVPLQLCKRGTPFAL